MITNILYKVSVVLILLCSNFIFSQDSYGISKEFHERKREMLRSQMKENTVAVLFSYPIRNRSNTIDYVYHQNPNFYYLTGWKEPHAVLVIYKNNQKDSIGNYNEILFVRDRNPFDEQWNGKRMGVEEQIN